LIVLDLRRLDFMDSIGLRILIGADARARDDGRRL
jgi:anti-anti-sigma factor